MATPSATGVVNSSARMLDSTVPNSSAAIPKTCVASGLFHSLVVQKFALSCCSAGIALTTRKTAIATSSANTTRPALSVTARKTASPRGVPGAPRGVGASAPAVAGDLLPPPGEGRGGGPLVTPPAPRRRTWLADRVGRRLGLAGQVGR